jgi:uncharacterized protein with von Willebrand factor type A (vWA) domain
MPDVGVALLDGLVAFGDRLREAEVSVAVSDVMNAARALSTLDEPTTEDVRIALRATLVRRREDLTRFDAVWNELVVHAGLPDDRRPSSDAAEMPGWTTSEEDERQVIGVAASADERLRTADPPDVDMAQVRDALEVATAIRARAPRRLHRRLRRGEDGMLDMARTLRQSLGTDGVPVVRIERGRPWSYRPWLLLIDASGSMQPHVLDWLIHAFALRQVLRDVEVFAFGTRLTRLTTTLLDPRLGKVVRCALAAVPDFAGGTRIGDSVHRLNRSFAPHSRGAVVLIVSDGWERGDLTRLATELALLRRRAHRIVWANPLAMAAEFEPLTGGMLAAGPSIDHLIGCPAELGRLDLAAINKRTFAKAARGAGLTDAPTGPSIAAPVSRTTP